MKVSGIRLVLFVWLFFWLLFLTSARPILPPPPALTSSCAAQEPGEESLGSGGQRERGGLSPAGPSALLFPALTSRLPSCLPGGTRHGWEKREVHYPPLGAGRPRQCPPLPPPPARPLRGQQVAKGSGTGAPGPPRPREGREGAGNPLTPQSRPLEGGTGTYSV